MKIEFTEHTNSTNDHILETDEDMALVYCDYQTAGRGQRGNTWESQRGANLTLSFLLKPDNLKAEKQFVISKMVALALVATLKKFDIVAKIKWPNDIYVGNLKISGILIENRLSSTGLLTRVICGVGLNVNQKEFESDAPNPVSMQQLTGREFDREEVLRVFCKEFELLYSTQNLEDSLSIDQQYWNKIFRANQYHRYIDCSGEFSGRIVGIGNYGELIVEREDNQQKISYLFKDVKYII